MKQKDLFPDATPPHHKSAPETSRAAAHSLPNPATVRLAVYNVIEHRGGATCDEVEQVLHLPHETASARIWELAGKNRKANLPTLITDSGERRATRRGRKAVVWVVL